MTTADALPAPLFDDNPAVEDLLGFTGVAEAVVRVLTAGGLDPVTVGVQGAWGGGKSTVLNLVAQRLESVGHVIVVRVDPWEFDDSQDVRGTLIALVLNALQEQLSSQTVDLPASRMWDVVTKLNELRRRIAWGRVAKVLVTSAATMTPDIAGLVDALTPAGPDDAGAAQDKPQSMAGFREDFESLMTQDLGFTKVVVLVDDLDRCLPAATVATLEAIKLFLSVKKMAFVLAADEDLVRASVDRHLGGLKNGVFAALYTEKIVQIPISLPVLTQHDAEAYVALLLAGNLQMTGTEATAMVERASERRRAGTAPYVVPDEDGAGPDADVLSMAATVATGLSADMWQTPRAVKRFLNNLSIRQHIARAAGVDLPLQVLIRMYVLELRHLTEFKLLAALPADERAALLQQWEAWGSHQEGAAKPEQVDERTRAWAGTQPSLAGRTAEIDRYLSFASTLRSDVRFGGAMDAGQRELVERLLSESDSERRAGAEDALRADEETQQVLVGALAGHILRVEDPEHAIESLTRLARDNGLLVPAVTTALQRVPVLRCLEPHHVPMLAALPGVLQSIVETDDVDEQVVRAARAEMTGR
ncbi:KAP family P-loop NTPase fold protein [Geodermatophilus chilensis]|uniref:KAP family P-loop NTPase fold protein n=1 Tax=Geodermatophilus chilensis TaxID=2035835 RepID=UPI000C25D999|nr:P-loop NTPase fold protein [Geodermatophilus chilensis]